MSLVVSPLPSFLHVEDFRAFTLGRDVYYLHTDVPIWLFFLAVRELNLPGHVLVPLSRVHYVLWQLYRPCGCSLGSLDDKECSCGSVERLIASLWSQKGSLVRLDRSHAPRVTGIVTLSA